MGKRAGHGAPQVSRDMLPQKRTAYALFFKAKYPEVKCDLEGQGHVGRLQRKVASTVAKMWRDLPEDDKQHWEEESLSEVLHRRQVRKQLEDEVAVSQTPAEPVSTLTGAPFSLGDYIIEGQGHELWGGTTVSAFPAMHRVLLSKATAVVYKNKDDCLQHLRVTEYIQNNIRRPSLWVKIVQTFQDGAMLPCFIQESYPTVSREGPLNGDRLLVVTKQIGLALAALHDLGLCHGDIRPSAVLWDPVAASVKITRLSFARSLTDVSPHSKFPYAPLYRPPELWNVQLKDTFYSVKTESWAYGVTVYELLTGKVMFESPHEIQSWRSQNAAVSVKFEDVSVAWRSLLLRLVQVEPESRVTVSDFVDSKSALANLIEQSDLVSPRSE